MFNKLKEKLREWIKKSKEDIEKKAERLEETKQEQKTKEKDAVKILSKKPGQKVTEVLEEKPDETPEDVKEEVEKLEKKIKGGIKGEEPLVKFEPSTQKYEPDIEKLKERIEEKKSLIKKLKSTFSYKITEKKFNEIFDELEMLLLENNVALEVVDDIKKTLSKKLVEREIKKEEVEREIKKELKNALNEILIEPDDPLDAVKEKKNSEHKPFVILFFGINGTGKTTSIAKLTHLLQKNNFSVVLAAADTFRAASIEQIQVHANRLNVPLIKHDYNADPSAVGFDAIKYAEKHKIDAVLIDTAGRMHTKTNLLAEMEKICRVTKPDLKIFVAESIAGNDAVEQAKTFHEMIDIDGSILSKADIDEKGGTIISVSYATHKPIFYLGTGQNYEDLKLFDKQEYIESLGL